MAKQTVNAVNYIHSHIRGGQYPEPEFVSDGSGTLKRLFHCLTREKAMIAGMLAAVIASTLLGVIAPSLQSSAIDIITGTLNGQLARVLLLMTAAYILYSACNYVQGVISAHLSQRLVERLRGDLFKKIIRLPIQYHDTHSYGDIMSRMTNDIENISNTISQSLSSLFSGVLTILGTASIMFWYCWQLTLLSFLTVFLTVFVTKVISKQVRKYSRRRQQLLGSINGTVEEMVSGYRTVAAYTHEDAVIEEFEEMADRLTRAGIITDSLSGIIGPVMSCVNNISFVIIAVFGGYFAVHGLISLGVVSAFIVYAQQITQPINGLAQIYGQIQTAIAGAERVFAVMDEPEEDTHGEEALTGDDWSVTFENVEFSYDGENPVIRNFSLTVPAKTKVALVGATGSGKTTICSLLMRFYGLNSGQIKIGGHDIANISAEDLRKCMAVVLQDPVLFSDTIRNNLKYCNEAATDEALERACVTSNCIDIVHQTEDGLDAVLSGGGADISQGQRQLLSIARAVAADPKILILDEATSNIDTRTERRIQNAMFQIMQNRTSIVIAHRLSTIRDADLIVVMDHGEIVEMGNHTQLLAQKGKYYELYMTQYVGLNI